MSVLLQCPYCPAQIKVSDSAANTTCPKCFKSFDTPTSAAASGRVAERSPGAESDDLDADDSAPMRINPWGACGFFFATLALLFAVLVGSRGLTYTLLGLGLAVVAVGVALATIQRTPVNLSWLGIGGAANVAALCLVLGAPGLLNRYWVMDAAVPIPDPNKLVVTPRDAQRGPGRLLAPDDWADGVKELIRQDDAQIRLDSVTVGPLSDKPGQKFLLVNIRFSNTGNEIIGFEGFAKTKHQPALKDAAGKTYGFLEQRKRKPAAGAIVYIAAEPQTIRLGRTRYFDVQLVFEAPAAECSALKLELPASAYGRKGVCKFTISEFFVAPLPEVKKK